MFKIAASLFIVGAVLLGGAISIPLGDIPASLDDFSPVSGAPEAPENFRCESLSTSGQTKCTWDSVSASADDQAQGYTIRFWQQGNEFATSQEQDFDANANEGIITHAANDGYTMAFQIRFYTTHYEGNLSPVVLV